MNIEIKIFKKRPTEKLQGALSTIIDTQG